MSPSKVIREDPNQENPDTGRSGKSGKSAKSAKSGSELVAQAMAKVTAKSAAGNKQGTSKFNINEQGEIVNQAVPRGKNAPPEIKLYENVEKGS